TVNGVSEIWRLQWKAPPKPECGPLDDVAFTCPCMGLGYGEAGQLDLVRLRNGREYERLALSPFFSDLGPDKAVVQRWKVSNRDSAELLAHFDDDDWQRTAQQAMSRRAVVKVMNFVDYDHDGRSTEFFIQTE